jgi:hypothetical protein
MPETFHRYGREGESMSAKALKWIRGGAETTALGLPHDDLNVVIASYLQASSKLHLAEPMEDPIKSWPGVLVNSAILKSKLADQLIKERGSGKRFDRMKADKEALRLIHMRKVWIVETWVSFRLIEDEITEDHWNEIGMAYLTDETAAEVIEHAFSDLGGFTKKQFEDFRKNHGLVQVPLAHRRSGVVVNGTLKITRIGRKRV